MDNLLIDNFERKKATYLELGWDEKSTKEYLKKKENMMQIATFNTARVSFSASSRRNRYYEIYDRLNMLNLDEPWDKAVDAIQKLKEKFAIFVISARNKSHQDKTLDRMEEMGFPLTAMNIFFKEPNEVLATYRTRCVEEIQKYYPHTIAVVNALNDVVLFDRTGTTSVALTTLHDLKEWSGTVQTVCENWPSLTKALLKLELPQVPPPAIPFPAESLMKKVPIIQTNSPTNQSATKSGLIATPSFLTKSPEKAVPPAKITVAGPPPPLSTVAAAYSSSIQQEPSSAVNSPVEPETPVITIRNAAEIDSVKKTQSMLDQAVQQQLFMGADPLAAFNADQSGQQLQIEELLALFMLELKPKLPWIGQRRLQDFFQHFTGRFQMQFDETYTVVNTNLLAMEGLEGQALAAVYMVLAKFVESIRDQAFERHGKMQLKSMYENLTHQPFEGPIVQWIQQLIGANDPHMVLLYNFSVLAWLATQYPTHYIAINIGEQIPVIMQELAKRLFNQP